MDNVNNDETFDDVVRGDIWVQMDEKAEARVAETLARARKTRGAHFVVEEGAATPLDQVMSVLFPNGVSGSWFVSNASTRAPRACRSRCPLGASNATCVLTRRSCSAIVLRPDVRSPSVQAMFPGNEILGIKGFVWDCPHSPSGARVSVIDFIWMPKCERRPYEAEVTGRLFVNDGSVQSVRRPENALRAPLFERLEPVSLRTKENLSSWLEYLDWRQHLLMATKVGIRYIAARLDPQERNLVFTVAAENAETFQANCFWERHEPVYAYPLHNSSDAWSYRELTMDECRERDVKKAFGVELDDFRHTTARPDLLRAFQASGVGCPWSRPYLADVAFTAPDGLVNRMLSEVGRSASPEDVAEFLQKALKLPASGFLSLSSVPDEILINRQRRALSNFAETGSCAAPFLMNYLFDITQARVPEKVEMPSEFRAADLNDGQKQAVATILAAPDVALVQGPPGTGKTTVIAEALWQFVRQGKRVLVVSQSGAAVDNALDRLANVPEIRAIRLMNARKSAEAGDEASRYAEANALGNFYGALGESVRRRVEAWDRLEASRKALAEVRPRLVALEERLETEDEIVRRCDAELVEVLTEAESKAIPALQAFEQLGVRVFEPAYNPIWPAGQRRKSLVAATRIAQGCCEEILPLLKSDIARLKGLSGETVVSDEDAIRLAELKCAIGALQVKMDVESDDDAYDRLSREQRTLRRQVREIAESSAFDVSAYERRFVLPDADGHRLAEMLSRAASSRTALLAVLEDQVVRLESALASLRSAGCTGLEGRLREIDERRAAAVTRRDTFANEGAETLEGLRAKIGDGPAQIRGARAWFVAEEARQTADGTSVKGERALLEPLYRGWLERLAHPGESDQERVLPDYIANCSIAGVTCTSDTRLLENNGFTRFDVVIIDEVSKVTPPELLMSMALAEKAVLVGDHRQLPPLFGDREPLAMEEIMQRDAEEDVPEAQRVTPEKFRKYERMVGASIFKEYFEQAPDALKCMLWEQYRMHPDIMRLVNGFYDNKLTCGLEDADRVRDHRLGMRVPWMRAPGHAYWIDSSTDPDGRVFEEEQSGSSKVNPLEVALIEKTLRDVDATLEAVACETGEDVRKSVGVIAFYGHQKRLLRRAVQRLSLKRLSVRVDTVDRFQGQERDYVLVSMTRNRVRHDRSGRASNAYVAKFERINVAFSRARELLLVFGARDMFVDINVSLPPLFHAGKPTVQPVYRRMIGDLDARGRLVRSSDILSSRAWHAADAGRKTSGGERKNHGYGPYDRRRR